MNIGLVGMNHTTAPVEMRERIALSCSAPEQPSVVRELLGIEGIKEGVYLSTCNRVEALFVSPDSSLSFSGILDFLAGKFGTGQQELRKHVYQLQDREAVLHLFRVSSSLDSMVIGEPQILGQVKDSYRQATDQKATGVVLNRLLHRAFFVAKRVRTETRIGSSAVSISYAAVELTRKIFDDLTHKSILLIGAGEMAELAVRHLMNNGVKEISVANRTFDRAVELARKLGGKPTYLEELEKHLAVADIVISSTGAKEYVVHAEQVKRAARKRRNRPLFFIDIAVPRDIDPQINGLDNCYVYNIDELQGIVDANVKDRKVESLMAERIVEEETIKFLHWLEGLEVVPTIVGLTEKSEHIRVAELQKTFSRLKELTPEEGEAIDVLTRSLIKKLLHDPIQFLKRERTHEENKDQDIDYVRRIFNLNHVG